MAIALMGAVPQAAAAAGDSISFEMARAAGATCLASNARARVTVSDLGPVQNLHIEMFGLTPNNTFTLFITQHGARPFGLSWYQGEIETNHDGRGVGDFTGIFSAETFVLGDSPVQLSHLGIWFADATDAGNAGCSNIVTPFDGDHQAGILVFSTSNFPDEHGPLQKLKDEEGPASANAQ
jgi:hypothetical protein